MGVSKAVDAISLDAFDKAFGFQFSRVSIVCHGCALNQVLNKYK